MDPLSQGILGSIAAQPFSHKKSIVTATVMAFISGLAPDADVLIRSAQDPLLTLEYHRQFTHSLLFIPIGGLICALLLHGLIGKRCQLRFKSSYLYCTLGYGTHGLLDACTSYGTLLLWPFSDFRVAWNTISIIDPLMTLPLVALTLIALITRNKKWAYGSLAWFCIYTSLGIIQRERATAAGFELANSRGHQPESVSAKPSFANLLIWKTIYTHDKYYYVDAVRMGASTHIFEGNRIAHFDLKRDFPDLDPNSQQAKDIERFRWFSAGFIAKDPNHNNRVIDIRYSVIPNELAPLWALELDLDSPNTHADFISTRDASGENFARFWAMITLSKH